MWLPLKRHGTAPFEAALDEKLLLAKYFYDQIQLVDGIRVFSEPDLSVVTFRFQPKQKSGEDVSAKETIEANQKLLQILYERGHVFLTGTRHPTTKEVMLRAAILSFRTHLADIDLAISEIKSAIGQLCSESESQP